MHQLSKRSRLALALSAAFALSSCTLDERQVAVGSALPGDGGPGAEGLGGGAGAGGMLGGSGGDTPDGPRLEVDTTSFEFGPVTLGTPALGSVRVRSTGRSPLGVPMVELDASSEADFTLLQNRCTEPLAPGAECEVRLQFEPSAAGPRAARLLVTSEAGGSAAVELGGTGIPAGDLALSADVTSSPNFGEVVVGSQREATFTLINLGMAQSGPLTLSLQNTEFQLLAPASGECVSGTTDLAEGATCNIRVAFAPTRRDELAAATLTVVSAAIGGASLGLTGVALGAAQLSIPAQVDFGPIVLGGEGRGLVFLENTGDEPLAVPVISVEGADAASYSVLENQCGQELSGRSSCGVNLAFEPLRTGPHGAELLLTTAAGEVQTVALLGEGLQPGALQIGAGDVLAPREFDFGEVVVETSAPPLATFRVTNSGATPSGALGIFVNSTSGGLFELPASAEPGDCLPGETSLEPGQGCNVRVRFQPAAPGAAAGSLAVTSELAGSAGLQLLGVGLSPARLALDSPDLIQFGQVVTGSISGADITLRNDGDAPLPPPSVELASSGPQPAEYFIAVNGCTAPLESQGTCTIRVELRPTRAGSHAGSLSVSAGAAGSTTIGLTGRAVLPGSLTVDPAAANFSALVGAQSEIQTFTVSNPGADSGPLRFNTTSPDFELQAPRAGGSDCVFNQTRLAEGQSCTIRVLFDPETRGTGILASLDVTSPSAGSDSVQLTGVARAPAALSGSQSTEFGTVVVGASARFTWNVSNGGDVSSGALQLSVAPAGTQDFRVENNGCAIDLAPASSCTLVVVFEPKSGSSLSATFTLQSSGTTLSLRASGSGRLLQQPGQRCSGIDASQCARAGDVCSFNHDLGGGGAICCNEACTNPCETCDQTGSCVARGNGTSCGTDLVCRGELCLKEDGQSCVLGTECASANCEPNRDICCAVACAGGQRCTADGSGCEVNPQPNGSGCNLGAECTSGRCVDSVCCATACNAGCEACNVAGSLGTCTFQPTETCSVAGQVCVARNQCAFPTCVVGQSIIGRCVLAN